MRYGITYVGSKNDIADDILSILPFADNFYDLFCGGGAILHCAKLSGKYKNFYANDINTLLVKGLEYIFNDENKNINLLEKRWISKKEFHKLKQTDFYTAYCFSFGGNFLDYCYGEYIEPWRKALYYAKVLNDFSFFRDIGIKDISSKEDIPKILVNIANYYKIYEDWFLTDYIKNVDNPESTKERLLLLRDNIKVPKDKFYRLENLARFERLDLCKKSLAQRNLLTFDIDDKVNFYNKSYDEIDIKSNSVLYLDPPYASTRSYYANGSHLKFDYEKFYNWIESIVNQNRNIKIFISEYYMPEDRFTCILEIKKRLLCNMQYKSSDFRVEKLFIPKNKN